MADRSGDITGGNWHDSAPPFLALRNGIVTFHLLRDRTGLYLIDGGFLGAIARIEEILSGLEHDFSDIRAVVLSHGHLDHTLNVAEIKRRTGCRVYAPAADRDQISGTQTYRGSSRLCGLAEALGRRLLRYQIPGIDHWFEPGDTLDLWGGLKIVPLSGHTPGHSGFLSEKRRLLFAGDLFSNYLGIAKLPPPWLNVDNDEVRRSVRRAATLDIDRVALNHGRPSTGEANFADLCRLAARV